jgi:hypothetical protein
VLKDWLEEFAVKPVMPRGGDHLIGIGIGAIASGAILRRTERYARPTARRTPRQATHAESISLKHQEPADGVSVAGSSLVLLLRAARSC